MARTHKHAPAQRGADQSTGRADWRTMLQTRDAKRELRRAHARNVAPQRVQMGAASLRLIVGASLAIGAALAARGLWQAVANALQALAMHGGV